uniref:D-isomer specific 2-hydroxyacid dehydrogenase catalytic domain-containing protein n=1 Tax=Aegilops tauschii subsp. strangulata TaxID=200361 RepID=A0A453AB36_AEGTS
VGGGSVRVDASFLDAVPSLRCVLTTGAGIDHIDLAECARRGVAVANSGEVFSTDVADYAVGLLLDVLRRVSAAERYVRRGSWPVQGDYPLGSKSLVASVLASSAWGTSAHGLQGGLKLLAASSTTTRENQRIQFLTSTSEMFTILLLNPTCSLSHVH